MAFELPKIPDYSVQQFKVDTGPAQVALDKAHQEQQMGQQAIENNLQTVKMATDLAQTMVEASKKRQQRDAIHAYALTLPNATPQSANLLSKFPDQTMQGISRTMFPTTLQGIAANQVQTGQTSLPEAAASLQKPLQGQNVTVMGPDGRPHVQHLNTQTMQTTDMGVAPQNSGVARAEEIKNNRIAGSLKALDQTLSPAKWTGTGPGATAAKLVANANSAVSLIDQIVNGEIPATKSNMAILNNDAARVVAQSGVVTNEGRRELQNRTGQSDFASALAYFTNNPQDQKQGAFLQVLKKELNRQQDLRQKTVDSQLAQSLPTFSQLRKDDEQQWAQALDAHGIDIEQAKKGKFVFKKDFINSLTGQQAAAPQADQTAAALQALRSMLSKK